MSKIWGVPSSYKSGAQNDLFGWLRNLTANLTAYIFGMKHDIDNRSSALTTTMGLLYVVPKYHELWSTNGFKLDRHFYPPYVNSAFYVIARLRGRRSENKTQPNLPNCGRQIALTICCRTVGVFPQEKMGPRNFYICSVFRRLRHLMENIFWKERDIDNRARARKYEGSPTLPKNFMNFGPQTG